MAHIASGAAGRQQLRARRRSATWLYENAARQPHHRRQDRRRTTTDSTAQNGQVYFYVGDKTGGPAAPIDKAGLTGGHLFGFKVRTTFDDRSHHQVRRTDSHDLAAVRVRGHQHLRRYRTIAGGAQDRCGNRRRRAIAGRTRDRRSSGRKTAHGIRSIPTASTSSRRERPFIRAEPVSAVTALWRARLRRRQEPGAAAVPSSCCSTAAEGQQMFDNITVDTEGKMTLCEDRRQQRSPRRRSGSTIRPPGRSPRLTHHYPLASSTISSGSSAWPAPISSPRTRKSLGRYRHLQAFSATPASTCSSSTPSRTRKSARPGRGRPADGHAPVSGLAAALMGQRLFASAIFLEGIGGHPPGASFRCLRILQRRPVYRRR